MSTMCQSSKLVPTLSKANALYAAKLANAITIDAFGIKCVFGALCPYVRAFCGSIIQW